MRALPHLFAALASFSMLGADASAATVTCQSRNNQRAECTLRGGSEVVLVRQLSKTTCEKGRNWDETRNGLYVTDGCGGVFETRDGSNDRPGQGGGWSGGPGNGNPGADYRDLVGVRASSGESELLRRGFRVAGTEAAPGGRLAFWRTPARGCIEVHVADGRFQAIRSVGNGRCDAAQPLPPVRPGPGHGRPPPWSAAESICLLQPVEGEAGDGRVERKTLVQPGVWELEVRYPNQLYICRANDRGQLISYKPVR